MKNHIKIKELIIGACRISISSNDAQAVKETSERITKAVNSFEAMREALITAKTMFIDLEDNTNRRYNNTLAEINNALKQSEGK